MADPSARSSDEEKVGELQVETPTSNDEVEAINTNSGSQAPETYYLKGWRLYVLTTALYLSLYLSAVEVTIVSTSLVTISNDLRAFSQSNWIVTAYLLTYTGFFIFWAKLSDILGRKTCICISVLWFVIFSAGCGAAQTSTQLIILRSFQGIGGSGIYALVMVILPQLVPFDKFAAVYSPMTAGAFSIAYLTGPLLGGVINNNSAWRWVFLLNVPCGVCAIIVLMFAIPTGFPHHNIKSFRPRVVSLNTLRRVDLIGTFLLLSASVFLVAALEETGSKFSWSSPATIIMLVLSGCSWIAFPAWSKFLNSRPNLQEPVFTWRFMQNRVFMGMLINTILCGVPFSVAVINIPQRMQAVNNVSPLNAGIRLLPFSLACPFGSALSGILLSKAKVSEVILLALGGVCQSIAAGLLSSMSRNVKMDNGEYGYEFLLGFGLGLNIALLITLTPKMVERRDLAVAMGAINQFRLIAGAIGLGVAANVQKSYLTSHLSNTLSASQLQDILQSTASVDTLTATAQTNVRTVFAEAYNVTFKILIGFGVAQVPASLLVWQRKKH